MNHQDRVAALQRLHSQANQQERLATVALGRLRSEPNPYGMGVEAHEQKCRELWQQIIAAAARAAAVLDCAAAVDITPDELNYSHQELTCGCGRHHPTRALRDACRDCRLIAARAEVQDVEQVSANGTP